MIDSVLVLLLVLLSGAFVVLVLVRTVVAERAAGDRGIRPAGSHLVRWLDLSGVLVTVLLVAAAVLRVVNAVS
ncbi:hypothetical protein [Amycolatopsis benzoatilytica]|uniref:hypothetical protein n=1 Tax=Amycolatopsis benzoatilytica TaxID=346045 RepID=UPI000381AF93|nr:hypothetical protein [Amycolatopsis benzoatilytica]